MLTYPKIETLFPRHETTHKIHSDECRLRCDEFSIIKNWLLTEKIDGTNIQISLTPQGDRILNGRTERAQIPAHLVNYLDQVLPVEKLKEVIVPDETGVYPPTTFFGEGYGPKIQSGNSYRDDVSFILFDVCIAGWWQPFAKVQQFARLLEIDCVPLLCDWNWSSSSIIAQDVLQFILNLTCKGVSTLAEQNKKQRIIEGVVARTEPPVFTKFGHPLRWKLKLKDF